MLRNRACQSGVAPQRKGGRYDRAVVVGAIVIIVAASWAYLLYDDWAMRHMDIVDMAMPSRGPWGPVDIALIFAMWAIMMVAMMLPSVVPTLLVYHRLVIARRTGVNAAVPTGFFAAGYLFGWFAFSAAATLAQWGLHSAALISPQMVVSAPAVGGTLLLIAGAYQWTRFKYACLEHCRSPLQFLQTHWRAGAAGAFRMGARHGVYCIGCCWLLMTILFVVGVMNLFWIATLTLFVIAEKALPNAEWLARTSGLALIAWGGWLLSIAMMPAS
jgi:predicted metal-binding membrane protein